MTENAAPTERAGQSNAPPGSARSHTLVVFANDNHGALDRIVGLLRRRRARLQTIAIGRSELPNVLRLTVVVDDAEVAVEQLAEQLRKVVDVRHVVNLSSERTIARELALVKVNSPASHYSEIIEQGQLFGAHVVDVAKASVTLEVTGNGEKVEQLVSLLQRYGVCEVARTGCVAIIRGAGDSSMRTSEDIEEKE